MKVVAVGVATQQVSLPIDEFPLDFNPRRYLPGGITIEVGGAGYTVARHSARLGHEAFLAAPIGEDLAASTIDLTAEADQVNTALCWRELRRTPRSVLLVTDAGQRAVFSDLLGVAEANLDNAEVRRALTSADVAVLGNLDLSRPLIPIAQQAGVPVAVDLQDVRDPTDPELTDFLGADVLTLANTYIAGQEDLAIAALRERGASGVIVVTMAAKGLTVDAPGMPQPKFVPGTRVERISTTEGAGDVFLAELLHALYSLQLEPCDAAARAGEATARHLGTGFQAAPHWFKQKDEDGAEADQRDPQELARHLGRPWVTGGW